MVQYGKRLKSWSGGRLKDEFTGGDLRFRWSSEEVNRSFLKRDRDKKGKGRTGRRRPVCWSLVDGEGGAAKAGRERWHSVPRAG